MLVVGKSRVTYRNSRPLVEKISTIRREECKIELSP